MASHAKLPTSLAYLQPFVNRLSRLPADSLNEDVDAGPLINAIRSHFGSGSSDESRVRFRADVQLLEEWLAKTGGPAHPAHWIHGFLSTCELSDLFEDLPSIPSPSIEMTCPTGWKAEAAPPCLLLRARGVVANFTVIDEVAWRSLELQWQQARLNPPPDPYAAMRIVQQLQAQLAGTAAVTSPSMPRYEATSKYTDICFGAVAGHKHSQCQTAPFVWKSVSYLLAVPGGRVMGQISRLKAGSFDEAPIESVLNTLRVLPAN
jgi:hypothetical protein